MITIKDIAKHTGFSINTVSRALNNKPDVNAETRERVLQAAEELGYVPNSLARSLVGGQSHTIGLVIADVENPFYAQVIQGVEQTARQHGYSTILANTNENDADERQAVQVLRSKRVDGLLIHPVQQSYEHIARLREDHIPFVLLNRHIDEVTPDYIINNNQRGAYLASRHLIGLGHRHIAHLTGPRVISSVRERISGYTQAHAEAGLAVDEDLIVSTELNMRASYQAALQLLSRRPDVTAIFTYSDLLAIGVYKAAREMQMQIPDRLSLVGFDDIEYAEFLEVPLTTVHQPMYEIGQRGFELLLEIINAPIYIPGQRRIVLEPRLVVRRSTAAPRA